MKTFNQTPYLFTIFILAIISGVLIGILLQNHYQFIK